MTKSSPDPRSKNGRKSRRTPPRRPQTDENVPCGPAKATKDQWAALYRDLVEGSLQGLIIVDANSRIVFANNAFAEMMGYPTVRAILDLDPFDFLIAPHERDRAQAYRTARLAGDDAPTTYELQMVKSDGSALWMLISARAIEWYDEPAVQITLVDVTERKRAEQARLDSEARLSTTLESVIEGIITSEADGTILSLNSAAEKMFGYEGDELIGQNVSTLMAKGERGNHADYINNYFRTGEGQIIGASREVMGERKDGEIFPLELGIAEMNLGDERYFVGTLRDITERKRIEEELHQAQKMESLGQLTGGVAHDFNNLLFTINGNLDLLINELGDDARFEPFIDAIIKACDRGANLTQHLLAFSRKQTLNPETVRIGDILESVTGLLSRTIGENIEVKLSLAPDTGVARIDPGQLQNALLNLAVNARGAMADGGKLTIEARNVALDAATAKHLDGAHPGPYVHISVKDTGTGMPPEALRRAFEPFFTTKEVGKGTGLGLSMVYGFVQQSGGFVTLRSTEGRGTRVELYLPATEGGDVARPDGRARIDGGSETILLVEDDSGVRDVAAGMLATLGYEVIEAGDGPAALRVAEQGDPFDLLLTDVILPGGLSGPDLAKMLGKQHQTLKVLFMSGYSGDKVKAVSDLMGQANLLTKPFRREQLARAVREALV